MSEPNADVIATLEYALAAAKRGEVRAVAIATVDADGNAGSVWAAGAGGMPALLGSSHLLATELADAIRFPDQDEPALDAVAQETCEARATEAAPAPNRKLN